MINTLRVLIILIFVGLCSCSEPEKSNSDNDPKTNMVDTDSISFQDDTIKEEVFEPFTYSITDSTDDVFVNLTHTDGKGTYLITWGNNSFRDSSDLNLMTEGRGYRLPPSFSFSNESFICIMTNWTGPFSENLFLPLKKDLAFKFFKEDIEWIDSTRSQICYIDPEKTDSSKTYWTYENLISGYKKDFEIPIYKNSIGYPWYSKITRKGGVLEIVPQGDDNQKIKIEIK